MRDMQELVRREVTQAMVAAGRADKIALQADAMAFVSAPQLFVVNAPAAGLEKVDFKSMLDGHLVLDNTPVMYWYIAGEALKDKSFPFSEGLYSVVADQQRGTVELRDLRGHPVARGNLDVCIGPNGPPTGTIAKIGLSGDIDKWDVNLKKHHIEICGHASVSVGGAEVKVEGCITVDWT
jgi:hypothetical protein